MSTRPVRQRTSASLWVAMLVAPGCWSGTATPESPANGALFATHALPDGDVQLAGDPDYFMPESMAPGCAIFDYDGDGLLDIYVVRGVRTASSAVPGTAGRNRLYRQHPGGQFQDVAAAAGVADPGFGMGVAVADIDNDGDLDLFVTNHGPDRLYRNESGSFRDITDQAGISDDAWSASAGFFDYDVDGQLDLFVTRYLAYDPGQRGEDSGGRPEYPAPAMFSGLGDRLYRNEGDATFIDVSQQAGIAGRKGKGLGLVFSDLDGDDRIDVYVANDGEPNFAWINDGKGAFRELAVPMGLAVSGLGQPEASMGIACGDVDGDQDDDLFVTHLVQESSTLYVRDGTTGFDDGTSAAGLGTLTRDFTGFGTVFLDVELDGDLDLLSANGRVLRRPVLPGVQLPARWAPYGEPNQLFLNDGQGHFRNLNARDGFCGIYDVSRGLAAGDIDDDGDIDVVVANANGTYSLCENRAPRAGHWLRVRAWHPQLRRVAHGARVTVQAAGRSWQRSVTATSSYLSSSVPDPHFGLGDAGQFTSIQVQWPDGSVESFPGGAADRAVTVTRGKGNARR